MLSNENLIQKADAAFVDDASKVDAYVEARFDTALAALASAPAPKGKQTEAARALEQPRPAVKVDHAREDAAEPDIQTDPQAYAEFIQAQYNRRVR